MAKEVRELRFPFAGVVRRTGYEDHPAFQPPFPAPWAMNVRMEDSITGRLRGGSFVAISAGARPSSILFRGRTLTFSGRAVTASRVGSSTDTSMSADVSDMLRPALFQFSEAGKQGASVVALVPHKDQYLLGFTASETWVQQGDPLNGVRRRVSDQVGIIGANAWCVAHDTVFFLTSRGLYSVGADGSGLKPVSEDKLPSDLAGVTDATCTLTYRHADRGDYVHKTGTDWFYDTERDQFWPFNTATTNSHLLIGPIRLGTAGEDGMVSAITGVVAASSGTVTWRIVKGTSAEAACADAKTAVEAALAGTTYSQYVSAEGSWTAGRSITARPRVRSPWVVLWLSCASAWAYESAVLELETPLGRTR